MRRSFLEGRIVEIDTPRTIADGQQTTSPGPKTFAVIQERVDDILTVADDAVIAAMSHVWERAKLVSEPSAAVAVAVVLEHRSEFAGRRVGIILSGGNVDLDRLPW